MTTRRRKLPTNHWDQTRVFWRVYVKARDQRKARRLLERIAGALGRPIKVTSCSRHRENPAYYDATFDMAADDGALPALVYDLLKRSHELATSWEVLGPNESANGVVEFEGIVNRRGKLHVPGLDWAHYTLYYVPPRAR